MKKKSRDAKSLIMNNGRRNLRKKNSQLPKVRWTYYFSRTEVAVDTRAETAMDTPNTETGLTQMAHIPSPVDIKKALSRVDGHDGSIGSAMAPKRTANGTIITDWYSVGNCTLLLPAICQKLIFATQSRESPILKLGREAPVALELGYKNYSAVWAGRYTPLLCISGFHLHASGGRCGESVRSQPYGSSSRIGNLRPCVSVTSETNLIGFYLQILDGIGPMLFSPLASEQSPLTLREDKTKSMT